jgi:hypothetical protein
MFFLQTFYCYSKHAKILLKTKGLVSRGLLFLKNRAYYCFITLIVEIPSAVLALIK